LIAVSVAKGDEAGQRNYIVLIGRSRGKLGCYARTELKCKLERVRIAEQQYMPINTQRTTFQGKSGEEV